MSSKNPDPKEDKNKPEPDCSPNEADSKESAPAAGLSAWKKAAIIGGTAVAGTAATAIAAPLVVGALGFGAGGIVAGSTAAGMMSSAMTSGVGMGVVSVLQSVGATGAISATSAMIGGAAAGTGAGIGTLFMGRGKGGSEVKDVEVQTDGDDDDAFDDAAVAELVDVSANNENDPPIAEEGQSGENRRSIGIGTSDLAQYLSLLSLNGEEAENEPLSTRDLSPSGQLHSTSASLM